MTLDNNELLAFKHFLIENMKPGWLLTTNFAPMKNKLFTHGIIAYEQYQKLINKFHRLGYIYFSANWYFFGTTARGKKYLAGKIVNKIGGICG